MSYCLNHLTQNVCADNLIETWILAVEFNFDRLQEKCANFIGNVIKNIPKSQFMETAIAQPLVFGKIFKHCVMKNGQQLNFPSVLPQNEVTTTYSVGPDSDCLRDLEEMFNDQLFTDVELAVDGKILKAHKSVLASKFNLIFREVPLKIYLFFSQAVQLFSKRCSRKATTLWKQ
jgi:hypothetical protein